MESMIKSKRLLAPVRAMSVLVWISTANAGATKVDRGKGDTIQTALDKAEPGETIQTSGEWKENVAVRTNGVTLDCLSQGNASIVGTGGSSTIFVEARNVRIANEVTGNNTGILVVGASLADLSGNNIHGNDSRGVFVARGSSADIVGNEIVDNGQTGVFITRTSSVAFSNDVTLGNAPNHIEGNDTRGIGCFDNSAVRFGVAPDYGVGNGSPSGTGPTYIFEGGGFCAWSGPTGPQFPPAP